MDGASCYHVEGVHRTLRSCRPGGRPWPVTLAAGCAAQDWAGCPPNSHDCNPLETVFAALQTEVGSYFICNPDQWTARRLREKILELWPRHAEALGSLIRNQPNVMLEIVALKGGTTGR